MGFIIGVTGLYNNISWISNTDPIIWTSNINEAKKYEGLDRIKQDLDDNLRVLKTVLKETKSKEIFIIEVSDDNQEYILLNKSKKVYLSL